MAFVCPPKEESEAVTRLSQQLKEAFKDMEQQLKIAVKPICIPCCVPLCDYPPPQPHHHQHEPHKEFHPPQVMVCYKEPCSKKHKTKHHTSHSEEPEVIRLHQSKSRELRASILYTGCQCEKRDGLQDDCPRTGCHGSPECLTSPPTCGPSEFCDAKHLGKKNKYSYLSQKHKGGEKGEGEGHGGHKHHMSASYKCYPASIEKPIIIPMEANPACCPCDVLAK